MKKIVVPTDFSTCADNAVDFAVQSASYLPIEVNLLHAFEMKGNIYTDYMGVNKEFNRELLDEVYKKMEGLKKTIEETDGLIVNTYVALTPLADAVSELIEEKGIDLVVMGTLGASGLKEKIWGSKTARIISKTKVPVIVIPHAYRWMKPEKILLATNRFEKDPAILDDLFEMAGLYKARVQVAVMTDEDDDKAETFLEHSRTTPLYENFLKKQYKEDTLTVTHLFGLEFEETLQKHIKESNIDMLAMITYQNEKSIWDRLFNRSQTIRMSYHTTIPILAIPKK